MPDSRKPALGLSLSLVLILGLIGLAVLLFFAVSMTTTSLPTTVPPGGSVSTSLPRASAGASAADPAWPDPPAQAPAPLPPERVKELQQAGRDILGDQVLAAGDPSYEALAALMPGMSKPREVVGVKHHPHDIGVGPDGSLELSDDIMAKGFPSVYFEVGKPRVRFGSAPAGCAKSLLHQSLPVVLARFEHDGIRFTQTVFGSSDGLRPDADLYAFVELAASNPGARAVKTRARLVVEPASRVNPPREWKIALAPGASRKIRVKIPFVVQTERIQVLPPADYDKAMAEVVEFWGSDQATGTKISLPELRVVQAARAWLAFASLDVDMKNGVLTPHDGAGFYENVHGYSAALYPHALDLWGRHAEAAGILESLLKLQAPDGLFTSHFGTPDPGVLLFALWEHYNLTRDGEFLRRVAPNMVRMADWIIGKRKESIPPAETPRPVTYGLIKFSPYGGYQDPTYNYFGDTYCAVGLEKTAKALAALGMSAESARMAGEAAAYRRDILASMDAAVITREGRKILPMEPDTHRLLEDGHYRSGGYYGLVASCLLESGFLPAADPRAGLVMRFLEETGGLRLGMSEFDGGIDHATTYGYWLNCLKLGRAEPVLLGLYGSLAYGMSRETYAGVEVSRLFRADNDPTLPHLYSCTQQLRLLRMMLVREEGEDLHILSAAPRDWLAQGRQVEVQVAPTRFGEVSFAISSLIDEKAILVELGMPARRAPEKVVLRLRRPGDVPIRDLKVYGGAKAAFKGDTLTVTDMTKDLRIAVLY